MTAKKCDPQQHYTVLIKILKAIYTDPMLRTVLGFKGGTAAVLFYGLPRVSVDLDFDLLDSAQEHMVFERLKESLHQFVIIKDATKKHNTLFFLIDYQTGAKNIKIDISRRGAPASFQVKTYLGIPMAVMNKTDMITGKLAALPTRKKFAARDLYDLWYFLEHEWEVNEALLREKTGLALRDALNHAIQKIENLHDRQLLQGVGKYLSEKQKVWVRNNLKKDLLFLLKLYRERS